jgi:hypothetical protein
MIFKLILPPYLSINRCAPNLHALTGDWSP